MIESNSAEYARLLERYGGPGPRYTSYPSAVEFDASVGPESLRAALGRASAGAGPLSLYVHVPFCSSLCLYCGCSVVISRNESRMDRYVTNVLREADVMRRDLGGRRAVAQLHLGGGSPNWLPAAAFERLARGLRDRFSIGEGAEVAVELDPRTLDPGWIDRLRDLGFNRLSFGCQDFDSDVQRSVRRLQPLAHTRALVSRARAAGFGSISLDLMLGLPRQTPESFSATLAATVDLGPDRVSVFPYAHVPWMRPHQRLLEREGLPDPRERMALTLLARERLLGAGFAPIGMDHYARPDDELAVAEREGRLHRNFQGYTIGPAMDLLALGVTAISDVAGTYAQNAHDERTWSEEIEAGRLATARGFVLSADDLLRRRVIRSLLCAFRLDLAEIEGADEALAGAREKLAPLEADGLVRVEPRRVVVTDAGRPFVRAVAMAFDAYTARRLQSGRPALSRMA